MKSILTVMSVLLLLPCTLLAENWGPNSTYPVANFSFEEYNEETAHFDDWTLSGSGGLLLCSSEYSIHYVKSAQINAVNQSEVYLKQDISINPGIVFDEQPCYLMAYVKTQNVSSSSNGGVMAKVITKVHTGDTTYITKEFDSNIISGDRNWTKLIIPFDLIDMSVRNLVEIQIGLFNASGKVWMDFVQLIPRDCMMNQTLSEIPHLKNISFENYSPNSFENWNSALVIGHTLSQSSSSFVIGSHSAQITANSPMIGNSFLYQSTTVPQDFRTYYFSGYVRTENLDDIGEMAYYQISYPGLTVDSKKIISTNGWVHVEKVFEKPKDTGPTDPLLVKAVVSAKSGKAWFDWVNLKLNLVQNVEFNNWAATPPPNLVVWKKENISGYGTAAIDPTNGHNSNPCGKISNSSDSYDTLLYEPLRAGVDQGFMCLHEGGTYQLTGWIKTQNVVPAEPPEPGAEPEGAYVELIAIEPGPPAEPVQLTKTDCFTGTSDWQQFSVIFSLPYDWFTTPEDDGIFMFDTIYHLRCRLRYASGSAYFDDINIIELEPTEDVATVVPQPQAVSYYGNISDPLVDFNVRPNKVVTIYYTQGIDPANPPQSDPYWFSADYLRQEINRAFYQCTDSGDEDNIYQYPIESGDIICLNAPLSATQLLKPCIIIGDPTRDLSQHHLFQNELAKRDIALPQNFNPEGYLMEISEDVILIAGNDYSAEEVSVGAGSYYGMQTLLQTLEITAQSQTLIVEDGISYLANTVQAPALYAYDYPDLPWRAEWYDKIPWDFDSGSDPSKVLKYMFDPDDGEQYFQQNERDIALFSALKTNKMYIETGVYYYQDTEDPTKGEQSDNYDEYWDRMEDLFACCRRHHIEPIPLLQSGGHSAHILYWHPEFAECMWRGGVGERPPEEVEKGMGDPYPDVREERQFLTDSFALSNPNVFFQPESGLQVRIYSTPTGGAEDEYYEGVDWTINYYLDKKPFFRLNPNPGAGGFNSGEGYAVIHRIPESQGGSIPPNATVYVSYNYIWSVQNNRADNLAYCTAAPGLYDYMENVIDKTIETLHPKYIHFGHDEVMQYHTDKRDRDSIFEQSLLGDEDDDMPSRLLATDLDKLIDIIKDRPNPPQVILWGDMFNEIHRGSFFCSMDKGSAPGYFQGLARPCDMGGVDDYYDGGVHRGATWHACRILQEEGHPDIVLNDWTTKSPTYMNDTGPASYIGDIIDWQLKSGFTTLGCGYSTTGNFASANFKVKYTLTENGPSTEQTVYFTNNMLFSKDSWYSYDNQTYKTPAMDLTRAYSVTDAFVTARIENYIFGRFWFDDFYLHRDDSQVNLLNNPSFELSGGGQGHTFLHWEDNICSGNEEIDFIHRDSGHHFTGSYSCRFVRTQSAPSGSTNLFVIQHKSDFVGDYLVPGYQYILEGYMRAQDVESYVFNNCYNWTHQLYERYAKNEDCPGGAYFGYYDFYPSIIQDWLWSINYPHRWWLKSIPMPYDKIGNLCGANYPGFYPLEALYPQEAGK